MAFYPPPVRSASAWSGVTPCWPARPGWPCPATPPSCPASTGSSTGSSRGASQPCSSGRTCHPGDLEYKRHFGIDVCNVQVHSLGLGFGFRLKLDLSVNRLILVCSVKNRLNSVNLPLLIVDKILHFITFLLLNIFELRKFSKKNLFSAS